MREGRNVTVSEVADFCLRQFPDLVVSASIIQEERTVRLVLRDRSFVDVFVGRTGRYSYHWQTGERRYRFNNAPHYDQLSIETAPHHLHTPDGSAIEASVVRAISVEDITRVLQFVAQRLP